MSENDTPIRLSSSNAKACQKRRDRLIEDGLCIWCGKIPPEQELSKRCDACKRKDRLRKVKVLDTEVTPNGGGDQLTDQEGTATQAEPGTNQGAGQDLGGLFQPRGSGQDGT